MKNVLIVGLLAFAMVVGFAANANATRVEKYADAVIGTEDADTWVCSVQITCDTDNTVTDTFKRRCYVRLIDGDSATVGPTDVSLLSYSVSVTTGTATFDYCGNAPDKTNKYRSSGVFFDRGLYLDEVTGVTAVTIDYFQQP
jgi:hypothetical protein